MPRSTSSPFGGLLRETTVPERLFDAFMQRRYARCRITHDSSLQVARWELRPDPATDIHAAAQRQAQAVAEPLFPQGSLSQAQDAAAADCHPSQARP